MENRKRAYVTVRHRRCRRPEGSKLWPEGLAHCFPKYLLEHKHSFICCLCCFHKTVAELIKGTGTETIWPSSLNI